MEFRPFPQRRNSVKYNKKNTKKCTLDYENDRVWEPSYLKARCKDLQLEDEYRKYQVRLMISYLGVFFLLHIVVAVVYQAELLLLTEYTSRVYPNVAAIAVSAVLMLLVLSINFFEDFVQRHRWVMVLSSYLATFFLIAADLGMNAYHYIRYNWPLSASMDIYALCMIYMFLPIPSIKAAACLSVIVSVCYVTYFVQVLAFLAVYSARSAHGYEAITVDIFHYLGFNMMGIFFRYMNDTMVRASFLDRHQFIMEENWLRHALQQESMLLHSTLPPQIAKPYQESIRNKIMQAEHSDPQYGPSKNYESSMTVQFHPDVSILYADVVNYTHLTTTLSVESLVKVLHDLYGRFDMAASIYKVQRIKFLGDCYYCVSGLVAPDPDHAKNAVALGLAMIANIQEVRAERSLDIDMRIGIHSGALFAGVIGQAKLQFDIWGADVDIANHLESTGMPGQVHISGRTLSNLNPSEYTIMPGTEEAQEDPVLQKHPMSTHLITSGPSFVASGRATLVTLRPSAIEIKSRPIQGTGTGTSISMTEELREEFRKMPVGGFDFRSIFPCCHRYGEAKEKSRREIGRFCTAFRNSTLERNYLQQPDFVFKGSVLLAWLIGLCLIYIQLVSHPCPECIAIDILVLLLLTSLLFISWYKKLCWWKYGIHAMEYSRLSCIIFHTYEKIQRSLFIRICCYLMTIACYYSVISLIVLKCDRYAFELEYIESKLFHYEVNRDTCFHPWAFTNMMALILGMTYTFARIPFALKTCIGCIEAGVYLVILFSQYQFVFQHSTTIAPYMRSEVAHCNRILLMLVTLYVKERQVEFNAKTNYRLNVNLKNKQKVANATNQSIIILLNNILPSHVVSIYLNSLAKHELYYENYQMVSVMFAKLMNFKMDLPSLRVLNCIITEFDILLSRYKEYYMVEKIKVVGCTYMAACGLDFSLARKSSSFRNSRVNDIERARGKREDAESETDERHDEVVYLMTTFALDLMRTLASCNRAYADALFDRSLSSTEIAIGISSGEIMAGVVGASQPHYDIWGNPVNMASRMQSTGLPGNIQVTEESADILTDFDIICKPRGLTYVKGRGKIPTYWVSIDDKLNFTTRKTGRVGRPASSRRFSVMSMIKVDDDDDDDDDDESNSGSEESNEEDSSEEKNTEEENNKKENNEKENNEKENNEKENK